MLKLKQGVVAVRVDQDTIIVDTNTGRYFAANTIAYEMIAAMLHGQSDDEAVKALTDVIDIDEATLRNDIQEVRDRLADLDLSA
jgi:hypothetical protein